LGVGVATGVVATVVVVVVPVVGLPAVVVVVVPTDVVVVGIEVLVVEDTLGRGSRSAPIPVAGVPLTTATGVAEPMLGWLS
jgi:hypothetical protein